MSDDLTSENPKKEDRSERLKTRIILAVLTFMAVGMVGLKLSPPQIAPWWDCRVGVRSQNLEARVRLLSSCLRDGDLSDYDRAVIHFKRGNAFSVTGRLGRSIEDYDEAIRLRPGYADAYYNRGNTYRDLKKFRLAVQDFGEAVRLNPRDAEAFHNRGHIHMWFGRRDLAMKDLNTSLRLKPDQVRALFTRSFAHAANRDFDRAIEDLNNAIRLNPKNAQYHLYRARAQAIKGNLNDAIRDANTAIRLSETSDKPHSAADIRRFYDGFNFHNDENFGVTAERRRPQINLLGKTLLVVTYAMKLKSEGRADIEGAQTFLKDAGYYVGEIDGVFRPDILKGLIECVAAVNCNVRIDAVSGLK